LATDALCAIHGAAMEMRQRDLERVMTQHMAQLQHNMWVTNATDAVLSIITGGGKMGRDQSNR
jgi:hypothetical protein